MTDAPQPNPKNADTVTDPVEVGVREAAMSSKEWIWITVTALGLLVVYFSPLRKHVTQLEDIHREVAELGHLAPLVFVVVTAILTGIGLPRMLLCPIGGIAFGFTGGLLWNMVGALLGSYITFIYARWAGRSLILRRWPRLARVADYFKERSFLTVALFRQLPNPGFLTNLFFGITPIRTSAYLIGTAVGYLPSAIPATLLGSSTIQTSPHAKAIYAVGAVVTIIALWVVFGIYMKKSQKYAHIRHSLRGAKHSGEVPH